METNKLQKTLKLIAIGPAGSGKSTFISALSEIPIKDYITAYNSGANTTPFDIVYNFRADVAQITISNVIPEALAGKLEYAQSLFNGQKYKEAFKEIHKLTNCFKLTLTLPLKKTFCETYDSVKIIDTVGLNDTTLEKFTQIENNPKLSSDIENLIQDANVILLFDTISGDFQRRFAPVLQNIIKEHLKTPIIRIRPQIAPNDYNDLDQQFLSTVKNKLEAITLGLSNLLLPNTVVRYDYQITDLVFSSPEISSWSITEIDDDISKQENDKYLCFVKNVTDYAYNAFCSYTTGIQEAHKQYIQMYKNIILKNLNSPCIREYVGNQIALDPIVGPANDLIYRDTMALAKQFQKREKNYIFGEELYLAEDCSSRRKGERYKPSYSYSCINFREYFPMIINHLLKENNSELYSLFKAFLDNQLEEYTINSYSGYTGPGKHRVAFKFNFFVKIRNKLIVKLKEICPNMITDDGNLEFIESLESAKAIAKLIYMTLLEELQLTSIVPDELNRIVDECAPI